MAPFPRGNIINGMPAQPLPAIAPIWADLRASLFVSVISGGEGRERLSSIEGIMIENYPDFSASIAVVVTWFEPTILGGEDGADNLV